MSKLYIKCQHRNIVFTEKYKGDRVIISDVRCADCEQEMPPAYKAQIEQYYTLPPSASPLRVFPNRIDLMVYKHGKEIVKQTKNPYTN